MNQALRCVSRCPSIYPLECYVIRVSKMRPLLLGLLEITDDDQERKIAAPRHIRAEISSSLPRFLGAAQLKPIAHHGGKCGVWCKCVIWSRPLGVGFWSPEIGRLPFTPSFQHITLIHTVCPPRLPTWRTPPIIWASYQAWSGIMAATPTETQLFVQCHLFPLPQKEKKAVHVHTICRLMMRRDETATEKLGVDPFSGHRI